MAQAVFVFIKIFGFKVCAGNGGAR